ncbi:MAG: hypothetical protein KUL75_07330 [Sterolibacterium sp.]|nr:hypothetical protein [Sterolibacterium sp.]
MAKQGGLGRLRYDTTLLKERLDNDGGIAGTLVISLDGDTFSGAVGGVLGKLSNVPAGLTASLVKTSDLTATLSFSGNATKHMTTDSLNNLGITFSNSDFTSAGKVFIYGSQRSDLEIHFNDVSLSAAGTVLTGSGRLPAALNIDLMTDTLSLNGLPTGLLSGSLIGVTDVDLSALVPTGTAKPAATITVSLKGDTANNVLSASGYGGVIEGAGGNDSITAGASVDRIKFAIDPLTNGVDAIQNFTLGKGGDILDFSAFLNKTGTSHLKAVNANSMAAVAWTNGDVLSVQGYNLTTSADIAGLFGAGMAYAAPTSAGKAVLISNGLTGDARSWYITNDGLPATLTTVDATEVQLVGTISNLNNILLVPLDAGNFA